MATVIGREKRAVRLQVVDRRGSDLSLGEPGRAVSDPGFAGGRRDVMHIDVLPIIPAASRR